MTVSVIFPTVLGREESLERAVESFPGCEWIILAGHPTCGSAWVEGARRSKGDYICFAADDLEAHPGFVEAMLADIDHGVHPAALVLEPDGSLQSCGGNGWDCCRQNCEDGTPCEWSPVPFVSRGQWDTLLDPQGGLIAEFHYCSDMLVSALLRRGGVPAAVNTRAKLTHYNHPAARGAGMGDQHERTAHDRRRYEEASRTWSA